jgi:hypothetical protein
MFSRASCYLRMMYDRFGYPGMFAAYNAGPGRFAAHLTTGKSLPAETIVYLRKLGATRLGAPPAPQYRSRETLFAVNRLDRGAPSRAFSEPTRSALFVLQNDPR